MPIAVWLSPEQKIKNELLDAITKVVEAAEEKKFAGEKKELIEQWVMEMKAAFGLHPRTELNEHLSKNWASEKVLQRAHFLAEAIEEGRVSISRLMTTSGKELTGEGVGGVAVLEGGCRVYHRHRGFCFVSTLRDLTRDNRSCTSLYQVFGYYTGGFTTILRGSAKLSRNLVVDFDLDSSRAQRILSPKREQSLYFSSAIASYSCSLS
jgi:hypothetical protein